MSHTPSWFTAVIAGAFTFGAVTVVNTYYDHWFSQLRVSERKQSVLSIQQREELFQKTIVPLYDLKVKSREYKTLERVCIDGVYGSHWRDISWNGDRLWRVGIVYEACGWELPDHTAPSKR